MCGKSRGRTAILVFVLKLIVEWRAGTPAERPPHAGTPHEEACQPVMIGNRELAATGGREPTPTCP